MDSKDTKISLDDKLSLLQSKVDSTLEMVTDIHTELNIHTTVTVYDLLMAASNLSEDQLERFMKMFRILKEEWDHQDNINV